MVHSSVLFLIPKGGVVIQDDRGFVPDQVRTGGGVTRWVCAGPRLQVCTLLISL